MRRALVGTNLFAGLISAVVLLGLVFGLQVPLWLGVVLAVACFAGVALLRPGSENAVASDARAALNRDLAQGATEVAELRRLAHRILSPAAKVRVLDITDSADRILGVLRQDRPDPDIAASFLGRYLGPAQRLVAQYVRVAERGVSGAAPALAKIEQVDLPLLDQKLRELYDGLHRGDLIDLEVASEMLEFDLTGVDAPPPRRLQG